MSLANITELDAFVRDEVLPKVESQIIVNNAVMSRLEGKGKYFADSGEHIRTAARYERLPGGSYARGTKFSTTQKETVKEFIHDWRMYYVDVTVDKIVHCLPKISLFAGKSLESVLLYA